MRFGLIVPALVTTTIVAACGGSAKPGTSKNRAQPTTGVPGAHGLSEGVRIAGQGPFASSIRAGPGETVQFRTLVGERPGLRRRAVRLELTDRAGSRLSVTAVANGRSSAATVTTAHGDPLELVLWHFACPLPPVASFCPLRHEHTTGTSQVLTFSTTATVPIVISAIVARTGPNYKAAARGRSQVPPYKVLLGVRAFPPNVTPAPSSSAPPPSVQARSGDQVAVIARLTGLVGAPQTVTVVVDQGPGSSIDVSAGVPGGVRSHATIRSADGTPIALSLGRYTCYVPPAPTFCPPELVSTSDHRYRLKFASRPREAPIVISAVVGSS